MNNNNLFSVLAALDPDLAKSILKEYADRLAKEINQIRQNQIDPSVVEKIADKGLSGQKLTNDELKILMQYVTGVLTDISMEAIESIDRAMEKASQSSFEQFLNRFNKPTGKSKEDVLASQEAERRALAAADQRAKEIAAKLEAKKAAEQKAAQEAAEQKAKELAAEQARKKQEAEYNVKIGTQFGDYHIVMVTKDIVIAVDSHYVRWNEPVYVTSVIRDNVMYFSEHELRQKGVFPLTSKRM